MCVDFISIVHADFMSIGHVSQLSLSLSDRDSAGLVHVLRLPISFFLRLSVLGARCSVYLLLYTIYYCLLLTLYLYVYVYCVLCTTARVCLIVSVLTITMCDILIILVSCFYFYTCERAQVV